MAKLVAQPWEVIVCISVYYFSHCSHSFPISIIVFSSLIFKFCFRLPIWFLSGLKFYMESSGIQTCIK